MNWPPPKNYPGKNCQKGMTSQYWYIQTNKELTNQEYTAKGMPNRIRRFFKKRPPILRS